MLNTRIQKILTFLGVILLLGLFSIPSVLTPYTWYSSVQQSKEKEGWELVFKSGNITDLSQPWTFIKKPISHLGFVKETEKLNENNIFSRTLWVLNSNLSSTTENETHRITDCKNKRVAYIEDDIAKWKKYPYELKWQDMKFDTPEFEIDSYLCGKL